MAQIMDPNAPADAENSMRRSCDRPGHADLVRALNIAIQSDLRNVLERSSARETVMRVAVGAVAKALLRRWC